MGLVMTLGGDAASALRKAGYQQWVPTLELKASLKFVASLEFKTSLDLEATWKTEACTTLTASD